MIAKGESRIVLIAFGVCIRLAIIAWLIFSVDYELGYELFAAILAMIILSVIFAIDLVVYIFSSSGFYRSLPAPFRIVYGLIGAVSMMVTVYFLTAVYFSWQHHLDKTRQPNNALQRTEMYKVQALEQQLAVAELRR